MARSYRTNAFLFAIILFRAVYATHNETVDDTSPAIKYVGTWLNSHTQPTRYNSTTHYTKVEGSHASFSFTGATHIYYMGYGLLSTSPDPTIDVNFDGTSYAVDQTTTSSERAQVILWSRGDLDPNAEHTIVCTKTNGNATGTDMNVDAFILTVLDPGDTAASTTQSSPSSDTSTTPPPASLSISDSTTIIWTPTDGGTSATSSNLPVSSQSPISSHSEKTTTTHDTAAIVGGTLGAVALMAIVAALCFLLGRNRTRRAETKESVNNEGPGSVTPLPNPTPSSPGPTPSSEESRVGKATFRPANSTVISDDSYTSDTQNNFLVAPAPPAYSPPSLPHTV